MTKLENRYLAVFSSTIALVGLGVFLLLSPGAGLLREKAVSSCQAFYASSVHSTHNIAGAGLVLILLVLIIKFLASIYKTRATLSGFKVLSSGTEYQRISAVCKKANLQRKYFLLVAGSTPQAFTVGIRLPRVIISEAAVKKMNQKELEAVLLHEEYHRFQGHALLFLLGKTTTDVFRFFPSLKDVFERMTTNFEQAADEFTQECQGTNRHLRSALAIFIEPDNLSGLYPQFSLARMQSRLSRIQSGKSKKSRLSKLRLAASLGSILIFSLLFKLPEADNASLITRVQAESVNNCTVFECMSNCIAEEWPRSSILTKQSYSSVQAN